MTAKELREITEMAKERIKEIETKKFEEYMDYTVFPHLRDRAESGLNDATFRIIKDTPNMDAILVYLKNGGFQVEIGENQYTVSW